MAAGLALLSSLLWGTSDFFGGLFTRRLPAVLVVLVSQMIALALIVPMVSIFGGWEALDPGNSGFFWWGVAAGIVGPIGLVTFYWALSIGTMGVVSPIAATGIVVPVVWGLAQGDRPSVLQYCGIVVGFFGVLLAGGPDVQQEDDASRQAHTKSIVLALVAALGFGGSFVCLNGGGEFSVGMTLVVQRSTSVLLMIVPVLVATRLTGLRWRDLPGLSGVGIGDAAANGAFAWSTTFGLLSVTAVLGSLYPVATLLLARGILGERLSRLQAYGVVLALVGIVLLAAG